MMAHGKTESWLTCTGQASHLGADYSSEHRNLFITGATGCGKTYMACAFGMEACKKYYNTRYVRMPDLLMDLDIARSEGTYRMVMVKYANPVLLILDE